MQGLGLAPGLAGLAGLLVQGLGLAGLVVKAAAGLGGVLRVRFGQLLVPRAPGVGVLARRVELRLEGALGLALGVQLLHGLLGDSVHLDGLGLPVRDVRAGLVQLSGQLGVRGVVGPLLLRVVGRDGRGLLGGGWGGRAVQAVEIHDGLLAVRGGTRGALYTCGTRPFSGFGYK